MRCTSQRRKPTSTAKHIFSTSCDPYFEVLSILDNFGPSRCHLLHILPTSSFDESDSQITRIGGHFFFQRDQLIHVPLRPHKSSIKELCLWASKPNTEVARQFLWKIASSAPVRTISVHTKQSSLTIFPNGQVTQAVIYDHLRMNSARVNIEEFHVPFRVVESKVSDDLICRCLGAAVADRSRLVHL